ncbi:Ribosomal large subunit pseudouridine synthase D [Clostridiaceae bacterium JG1575]|nr:Ribosomal large subunit pseudouridine synthase D [Clostridiaceae bacterium JG1575]
MRRTLRGCPLPEEAGQRVDQYLSGLDEELSRARIVQLIREDALRVNGVAVKPSYRVQSGDVIELTLRPREELSAKAQDLPLEILYEDEDLLVVNKPCGMVVHPAPGSPSGTLVNALMHHFESLSQVGGSLRPGLVHRIDKDTSGILVVAKNDAAHLSLSAQLKDHSMTRQYVALCQGIIKEDQGVVDAPLGRDPNHRVRMAVRPEGRRAVTHYRVQKRFLDATFVVLQLETGRTHQIRVHMAKRHHPVLQDPVYGKKDPKIPYEGQMLHAQKLGFLHPRTGKYLEFTAPVSREFQAVLRAMERKRRGRSHDL